MCVSLYVCACGIGMNNYRFCVQEDSVDVPASLTGNLPPKVVEVYTQVGKLLSHYTSGKLPKAFKIIPNLSNWEEVMYVTNPWDWSCIAVRCATRIFSSNLNPRMAQRFFNVVLLERVRDDIREHKRLNYHLYMALKKALYKPAAFFKGILLPLVECGDCTLREATIVGSILAKVSIPLLHSSAALLRLTSLHYSPVQSLFLRILINKKYNLPNRVVTALATHFLKFIDDNRDLPVAWHQCLLVFAQRYRNDVSPEHKERMKVLLRKHFHHQITPEVRRELFQQPLAVGVDAQ